MAAGRLVDVSRGPLMSRLLGRAALMPLRWSSYAAHPPPVHPPAVETLLERWVVHYYPQLPEGAGGAPHLSRSQLARLSPSTVYK